MVDHLMKLLRAHALGLRQVRDQAGIQIAGARAHRHACRRREAHAGVDALAVANRGEACPVAEMSQNHPAHGGRLRAGRAGEFFHEKRVGQAVKAVALDALAPAKRRGIGRILATRGMPR